MRRAWVPIKSLLLILLPVLLISACGDDDSPAPACRLTLDQPNGGETWFADSSYAIQWSDNGTCGELVALELLCAGAPCLTIADTTENDGSYDWICASCTDDTSLCRVRVTALVTDATDDSDADFTIVRPARPPCALTVTGPNGGETWAQGSLQSLTWSATGACGDRVRIELLRDGEPCLTIAAAASNDGEHEWHVARCDDELDGYAIRVTDLTSGASDTSDATFSVGPGCLLQVLAPAGGETWHAGETVSIQWDFTGGCARSARIELLHEDTVCDTLAEDAPSGSSFNWLVALCGPSGDGYRVRIVDPPTGIYAESSGTFTIDTVCVLDLTYPDGGEAICAGTKIDITWNALTFCGKDVRLDLLHAGMACLPIVASTENDGLYSWEMAACAERSNDYQIRVADLETGFTDTSDASFAIQPPCTLWLEQPNGGEAYCEGDGVDLVWTSGACCGDAVRIELLREDGVCDTLATGTANSGEYHWTAAACGGTSLGYRIRLTDPSTGASDASDGTFGIHPQVEITAPAADAVLCSGQPLTITWTPSPCWGSNVKIDLVRNADACLPITQSTPNDGVFTWTLTQCEGHAGGYQIRISDLTCQPWCIADSEGSFRIENCQAPATE